MRLVWVVIPLVLIGIVGIQESFAESFEEGTTETKKIITVVQKIVDGKPVIEKYEKEVLFYIPSSPTLDGCEKTSGWTNWSLDSTKSKIMVDLQTEIDSGKENLCVEIVLPFVGRLYSSNQNDLNTVLTNLDTLSKFLEDNGATLEENRLDIRKYIDSRSMHIGANIPVSLISELTEKDYVVLLDIYGKIPKIPHHISIGHDSKISYDLQAEIDSGKQIIPVDIALQTKKLEATTKGHSLLRSVPFSESEIKLIQKPIIELLENNDADIQYVSVRPNAIIATISPSLILELEKFDDIVILNSFNYEITAQDKDYLSEKTSIREETSNELILNIVLDANSVQLSISGDAQNLKEIPVPYNVFGKEIELLVNGVTENNFEIVTSSDSQILLTLQPTLFQDISIERDLPPISPLKQIKLGISHNKIICNEGLELIFKPSDNSPACVKPSTAEKLIERGWGLNPSFVEKCNTINGTWNYEFDNCNAVRNSSGLTCEDIGGITSCMSREQYPTITDICIMVCEFN